MTLHLAGESYRVVQAGPDAIKLKTQQPIPSGDAILEIVVDGRVHRQSVRVLPTSPRPDWISIVDTK